MNLKVLYFAILREQAGTESEDLAFDGSTPADLYRHLLETGRVFLPQTLVRPAVNGRFVDMSHALQPGDEIAFIPPVAGG